MEAMEQRIKTFTINALHVIEWVGLLIITIATIVAVGESVYEMVQLGSVKLQDLLLLFIYLEIITMVGLYFTTGKLPLRYPIYIAIVAIARYIIIGMKQLDSWAIVGLSIAILLLTLSALAIRYGHAKLPYSDNPEHRGRR